MDQTRKHYVNNKDLFESLVAWQKLIRSCARKKLPRPQIPEFVGECMMQMANRLSKKVGFIGYCVDSETEALTKRGWLRYDQITTDDIILSCDPADNTLKWGPIHEIYIDKNYDGMMFYLTGNGLDALVTPGHKFLTQERGLVKVEQLRQTDHILLKPNHFLSIRDVDFHGSQRCRVHKNSKLSIKQVLEARALSTAGVTCKELGIKYGVDTKTIRRACNGQSWKHVNGYESLNYKRKPSVAYKGVVWCPRTNYRTFVCRRNGKIYTNSNTFRDEMICDSLESCVRYIHNFNPKRSKNAFAYITQIIHNAFIRRIQKEQKQLYVKMRIVDEADFMHSYERQEGDATNYNNSYVTYLQENKGEVISKFENWKEAKKQKASAKKKAALSELFEDEEDELPVVIVKKAASKAKSPTTPKTNKSTTPKTRAITKVAKKKK